MNVARLLVATAASLILAILSSGVEAAPQSSTTGNCSPSFAQVNVSGKLIVQVSCGGSSKVLEQLAADMTTWLERARLNDEQTRAFFAAFDRTLPGMVEQLNRMEGKQDFAVLGITELLKRSVTNRSSIEDIERSVSVFRNYLPGTEMTECGCWGYSGDRKYGKTEDNQSCASGLQVQTACSPKSKKMCTDDFDRSYSPFQTICK